MFYEGYRKAYGFTIDKTIHAFIDDIKSGVTTMDQENNEQNKLAKEILSWKKEKSDINNAMTVLQGREFV